MEHLVVIVDIKGEIEPKLYSCPKEDKTKEEAIKTAKKTYENKHQNFNYNSYYFIY